MGAHPPLPAGVILPDCMKPRKAEGAHMWRGFLLYAMQAPGSRSQRAVGRAMHKAPTSARVWAGKHDWTDRCQAAGAACSTYAAKAYRVIYFNRFAMREVMVVERNMAISFATAEPMPSDDSQDLGTEGTPTTGEKVQAAQHLDSDANRLEVRRHISLLDALIRKSVKAIKTGSLKINSVNDLSRALKVRAELAELLGDIVPASAQLAGPQIEETYRVRKAEKEGGDVMEARLQDAKEAVALLEGMQAARRVAEEMRESSGGVAVGE